MGNNTKFSSQANGVLVLDKPQGPSSANCIAKIKRQLGQKKIGHAGTLDPMASGVLLVLLGQGTKLSGYLLQAGAKRYVGTVQLGVTTDTWDAEGQVIARQNASQVTPDMLKEAIAALAGDIKQEIPPYSAARHEGRHLYTLARKGLEIPIKTKTVHIFDAAVEWVDLPHFSFRVTCSSGTYIRSLAHSLGKRLGCGATLTALTREYSYPFGLEHAHKLEDVLARPECLCDWVQPIAAALPAWQRVRLNGAEEERVRHGMPIPLHGGEGNCAILEDRNGTALALAERSEQNGQKVWAIARGLWNQDDSPSRRV